MQLISAEGWPHRGAGLGLALCVLASCQGEAPNPPAKDSATKPIEARKSAQAEQQINSYSALLRAEGLVARPAFGPQGWVVDELKWTPPRIPVCWETLDPRFSRERALVERALRDSWEAHSSVDFIFSQGRCTPAAKGVHVEVADMVTRTVGVGTQLDRQSGALRLNFTFGTVNTECRSAALRDSCIKANAVHEFGHALSFVHEHNRHETPLDCTEAPDGPDGNRILTDWDPTSVMNYCDKDRLSKGGALSDGDKGAVAQLYGSEI
jgi:hypothetical protein